VAIALQLQSHCKKRSDRFGKGQEAIAGFSKRWQGCQKIPDGVGDGSAEVNDTPCTSVEAIAKALPASFSGFSCDG
jgi:hypothetical protein